MCFSIISVSLISCKYDNEEELYGSTNCPPEGISYINTIEPLISTNCAIPGCHIAGNQMPTLENYSQISDNADKIKTRTSNGTMPPATSGISLSIDEIEMIECWVDAGAPNN